MKFYILASFKMPSDENRIKDLVSWLNTGLKQFAKNGHFLNITSSNVSFLNDASRLVKGDPPLEFNKYCGLCRSKASRNHQPIKK